MSTAATGLLCHWSDRLSSLLLVVILGGPCIFIGATRCTNGTIEYQKFRNSKAIHPSVATHPSQQADIVIATEADWGYHNFRQAGVLGGFDIELTQRMCALARKACAIVTTPWQSAWPTSYIQFGVSINDKLYLGEGYHNRWFHCVVGTYNIILRQQSVAFTHLHRPSTYNR